MNSCHSTPMGCRKSTQFILMNNRLNIGRGQIIERCYMTIRVFLVNEFINWLTVPFLARVVYRIVPKKLQIALSFIKVATFSNSASEVTIDVTPQQRGQSYRYKLQL